MSARLDLDLLPPGDLATDVLTSKQVEDETGGILTVGLLNELATSGKGPRFGKVGSQRVYHRAILRKWLLDWIAGSPSSAAGHRLAPPLTDRALRTRAERAAARGDEPPLPCRRPAPKLGGSPAHEGTVGLTGQTGPRQRRTAHTET